MKQDDDAIMSPTGPVVFRTERDRLKKEFCDAYESYFQAPDREERGSIKGGELWKVYIEVRERWRWFMF